MNIGDIRKFESQKVAELLVSRGLLSSDVNDINDLISRPEFQVLRIIGQNEPISTENIEAKYETQYSLSLILSNLQSDDLIANTSDYKWKLSEWLFKEISEMTLSTKIEDKKQSKEIREDKIKKQREARKIEFKGMADAMSSIYQGPVSFIVSSDLFEVPELELLMIIKENQPVSTDEIEELKKLDYSLSLMMSNLQADNLIQEGDGFKWKLSDKLENKLGEVGLEISEDIIVPEDEEEVVNVGLSPSEAIILENRQLLKTLLDMNYFKNKTIDEIVKTVEFKILNVINSQSPIPTIDIDEKVDIDIPITMVISNLSADGLIVEEEDAWVLDTDFRRRINKVKISREEVLEQLEIEERANKEKQKQLKIEKEELIKVKKDTSETEVSPEISPEEPSIIVDDDIKEEVAAEIAPEEPSIIVDDDIKEEISAEIAPEDPSLIVDDDIKEEVAAEIAPEEPSIIIEDDIEEEVVKEEKEQEKDETETLEEQIDKEEVIETFGEEDPHSYRKRLRPILDKSVIDNPIIKILIKNGYLSADVTSEAQFNERPEYKILQLIKDNSPITAEELDELSESVESITMITSNLLADGIVVQDNTFRYTLSEQLEMEVSKGGVFFDRKKSLASEEIQDAKELIKRREEQFITSTYKIGYIKSVDMPIEELLEIPEFEILKIINDTQTIVLEELKSKAKSASPVLISRTISKLEAEERIINSDGNIQFTDKFKDFIIEDEVKEKVRREKSAAKDGREKRIRKMQEKEKMAQSLADYLISKNYIISESNEMKHLLVIPEFEILSIINSDGPISIEDLKTKIKSIAPVQVKRILMKLETDKMIVDKYEEWIISDDLKADLLS